MPTFGSGEDGRVNGTLTFDANATVVSFPATSLTEAVFVSTTAIPRSYIAQDNLLEYNIPLTALRVSDPTN